MRAIQAPGSIMFDNQGTWDLESQVADEKDARSPAVDLFGEAQLGEHRQLGEGDVGPVQVVDDVHGEDQRQHAAPRSCAWALLAEVDPNESGFMKRAGA